MKKGLLRVGDVIAIVLVLCLAASLLLFLLTADRGTLVEIEVEGEVIATLSLAKDTTKTVISRGITLEIAVKAGEVFVKSADCDDLVCMHTAAISERGASIVCAPAAVVIRIVGGGENDADFVAG